MKNLIEIDYKIHKVLVFVVPLAVFTFFFWLYLGPLTYLYVTVSDVLNLLKRRNSNFTKYRLVHLIVGYLYLSCFFISGFISSKWVATHISREFYMFIFWYMLPLCFFFFHFYFTKKDYQDFISDNT